MNLIFYIPEIIVFCNAYTILALILAIIAIKQNKPNLHKKLMLSCVAASAVLLVAYVSYHLTGGRFKFLGSDTVKPYFLGMLLVHTILATILPFIVARLLWLAHKQMHEKHKRLARPTVVAWLYVAITGVIIYFAGK